MAVSILVRRHEPAPADPEPRQSKDEPEKWPGFQDRFQDDIQLGTGIITLW
jgi:hypothetical protein